MNRKYKQLTIDLALNLKKGQPIYYQDYDGKYIKFTFNNTSDQRDAQFNSNGVYVRVDEIDNGTCGKRYNSFYVLTKNKLRGDYI